MTDYRELEDRLRKRHLLGDCVLAADAIKALREVLCNVKRYMPYDMAHDPVTRRSTFQAIEHPDGFYVLASDYDALRAQLDEARAEWATWGTIEVAIRNPNVASYIEHWEKRALSAEAERDALRVRVKELEVELAKLQDKINPPRAHYERP